MLKCEKSAAAILTALLSLLCNLAMAEPVPAFSLEKLDAESQLVAILGTKSTGNVFTIKAILKGDQKVGDEIEFVHGSIGKLSSEALFLVFARKDAEKGSLYVLSSKYYGLMMVESADLELKGTLEEKLVSVLEKGIESRDLLVIKDAVIWARYLGAESLKRKVGSVALGSPKPPVAIEAFYLECQIPLGDPKVLRRAVAFVDGLKGRDEFSDIRLWVVSAFAQIKRSDDVALLNSLLERKDDLATSLLFSAREWADSSSVKALLGVLDDGNSERMFRAILALSILTKRPFTTKYDDFMENPSSSVHEWKDYVNKWINDRGKVPDSGEPGKDRGSTKQDSK